MNVYTVATAAMIASSSSVSTGGKGPFGLPYGEQVEFPPEQWRVTRPIPAPVNRLSPSMTGSGWTEELDATPIAHNRLEAHTTQASRPSVSESAPEHDGDIAYPAIIESEVRRVANDRMILLVRRWGRKSEFTPEERARYEMLTARLDHELPQVTDAMIARASDMSVLPVEDEAEAFALLRRFGL